MPRSIRARRRATLPSRLMDPSRRLPPIRTGSGTDPTPGRSVTARASGAGRPARRRSCRRGPHPSPGRVVSVANGLNGSNRGELGLGRVDLRGELGQQVQIGGQNLPGDGRVRRGQRVAGGRDEPFGQRPANLEAADGGEPDEPGGAQRGEPVGSVNSAAMSLPTLVPSTSGRTSVSPGKARSSWPSSWFFVAVRAWTLRVRCAAHAPSSPITASRAVTGRPRPARTSSVIASRSSASVLTRRRPWTRRCSADVRRIQLHTCQPARPHGRGEQRPVVMPGSLDPDSNGTSHPGQPAFDQ